MPKHGKSVSVVGCKHCKSASNPLGRTTYLDAKTYKFTNGTTVVQGRCGNTGMMGKVFMKSK